MRKITKLIIILIILSTFNVSALELGGDFGEEGTEFSFSIQTRSGSPINLEISIDDPAALIDSVRFESENVKAQFSITEESSNELFLRPFLHQGIYPLKIIVASNQEQWQSNIEMGFVDYIWGRDNFRYSNKRSKYWGITPYSKALFPWIESHFGELPMEDCTLLLNTAYHIFTGRVGRCYAFSASQIMFLRHPELLPSYYKNIYAVRETNTITQNRMNMLQNSIMFDHFILGGYDTNQPQSLDALRNEVDFIISQIQKGELVSVGFWNTNRHHSLLIYGYILDPQTDRVSLIAANNWGAEHNENLVSEATELIDIELTEYFDGERITWVNAPYSSYDFADHLFAVEVKDSYDFSYDEIYRLIDSEYARLSEDNSSLIIIEQADEAMVIDDQGLKIGLDGRKTINEITDIAYRQVSDTFIFELPANKTYKLIFTPLDASDGDGGSEFKTDCNIYYLSPEKKDNEYVLSSAFYSPPSFSEDQEYILQINSRNIELHELSDLEVEARGTED